MTNLKKLREKEEEEEGVVEEDEGEAAAVEEEADLAKTQRTIKRCQWIQKKQARPRANNLHPEEDNEVADEEKDEGRRSTE